MGGKHLKKLRAEKSKVHLKKKKLAKGQNVTDTAFKVKKILLVEQLKKVNEGEPVSNWNVPIKDLLTHLNHHNFTSRLNGLCGIKEVLMNYPEITQGPSFKSLVSRLLDLLTDEEHKIRMTVMDLLTYLFDMIPSSAILPFHDVLSAHLGCAMTHRDISVQWDSLNFIDIMIKYSPEAIRQYFVSVVQNFVRILKKFFIESHRVLSVSGGRSKEGMEKLKLDMFSRLYEFLAISFSEIGLVNQSFGNNLDITSLSRKKISLRESNDQYKQIPDLSSLFINLENIIPTLNKRNYVEFQSICSLIMPLVSETWMECCPDRRINGTTFECILSDNIATLLCVLLKIIMTLFEQSVALESGKIDCWFVGAYSSTFKKCFTSGFPYLPAASRKKSSSSKLGEFLNPCSSSCVLQNLIICYLSYSFKLVLENKDLEVLMENYISRMLTRKIYTEAEMLLKVVEALRNTSVNRFTKVILGKVVDAYDAIHEAEVRRGLSKALLKVVLEEDESTGRREQSIIRWMRSLPGRICETPLFIEVAETILQLVNRPEGEEVLKDIESKAFEIFQNMPNVKMEGVIEFEGQKMIANILYRCNKKVVEELLKNGVLSKGSYSEKLREYIENIFHHKLTT